MENSKSGGPMVPLVCLFFVCLCGLVCLTLAALLDPCQRKPRTVHRSANGDVGGSVASLGSVASTEMNSEEMTYYSTDGYSLGNSVGQVGTLGGSVYTLGESVGGSVAAVESVGGSVYEYGYLPQDPNYAMHTTTYNYGGGLSTVQEVSEPSSSMHGYAYTSPQTSLSYAQNPSFSLARVAPHAM